MSDPAAGATTDVRASGSPMNCAFADDCDDDVALISIPLLTPEPPSLTFALVATNRLNAAHCIAASRFTRSAAAFCFLDFFRGFATTVEANASNRQPISKANENLENLWAISLSLATELPKPKTVCRNAK